MNWEIEDVSVTLINPSGTLQGFAHFIINNGIRMNNVAIHMRKEGGIRLIYQQKRGIDIAYPINKELGSAIERKVQVEYQKAIGGDDES